MTSMIKNLRRSAFSPRPCTNPSSSLHRITRGAQGGMGGRGLILSYIEERDGEYQWVYLLGTLCGICWTFSGLVRSLLFREGGEVG